MNPLPPPSDGNVDRGAQLLACIWTPVPIAVVLMVLRGYVRLRINGMGADDYLMLIALVIYIATFAIETVNILGGGTRHIYYVLSEPDHMIYLIKLTWISQPLGIMASAFGKCSVAFLISRIMGPNSFYRKWFLNFNTVLYMSASIVASIIVFCQCQPAEALWTQAPGAKCWDPNIVKHFDLFQSSYGAALDFFLALLPISIVWNLRLNLKKRLATCILLGLGIIAGVCASVKTAALNSPKTAADFTWSTFDIWVWTSLELSLVIICGCVPTLKPLWDQLYKGKTMGDNTAKYGGTRSYALRSNSSNRHANGPFKHLSSHTTDVTGGHYASMDHEIYGTSRDIQVQQEVSIRSEDDAHLLKLGSRST